MPNVSSHKTAQTLEAMGTVSQVDSDLNSSRCSPLHMYGCLVCQPYTLPN